MALNKIINQQWDIFHEPLVDDTVVKYEFKEIRETNVNVSDIKQFEFVTKKLDSWFYPSESYLDVSVRIVKENGNNLAATDVATLTNNGFNLFKTAGYVINDVLVEKIDHVGIATTITKLIEYSDDYSRSAARNHFWYKDYNQGKEIHPVAASFTAPGTVTLTNNADYNKGFEKRYNRTKNSKLVNMYLPLSELFGFLKENRQFFRGASHKISLERNDDSNMIIRTGNTNFKVVIEYLSWKIPIVAPSIEMMSVLEKDLVKDRKHNLRWEACNAYKSDVSQNKERTWKVISERNNPTKVVVMLQKNEKHNNQLMNNMVFDHMNLTNIELRINGDKYPEETLKCDFSDEKCKYSNLYNRFIHMGVKQLAFDTGSVVSMEEFKSVYPLFCFDVSKHESNIYNGTTADIEVSITLKDDPVPYNIYCIVYYERKATLDIINKNMYVSL